MTPAPRPEAGPAEGVLLVDKPAGPTSHDVVARVRKTLRQRRVGHTGTLDPFASGLLVLCVGTATRLSEYFTGLDKSYVAWVRLGQRTATHDSEAPVEEERGGWEGLSRQRIDEALELFRGEIRQRPPRFSAKKVGGEAAHRRVRRGEEVTLTSVPVTLHELVLDTSELPDLRLRLRCSSGTYVRALARDLGEALGVGAHLTALRRTRVGGLRVEDAVAPDRLDDEDALSTALLAPPRAMAHLPSLDVAPDEAARLAHGQPIAAVSDVPAENDPAMALSRGSLVAVVTRRGAQLRPLKVFVGGSA